MARIFISYRRSDSAYVAATLNDKLQQRFGRDSVFFDVDNIPLGVDFREHIANAVGLCDVLLVIMGDQWVQAVDDQGTRRIDDPSDYVRIEIETALKRDIPVIPVLVGEAEMPSATDLPPSVQEIVFRNAAELRAGRDLRQHIELLIQGLETICSLNPNPEDKRTSDQDSVYAPEQTRISNEGTDPSKILEEIRKALKGFKDPYLCVGEEIPPDQVNSAISTFAPHLSTKDVLLIYDNLMSGGLLLTAEALYWRNPGTEPGHIRYAEIQNVESREGGSVWLFGKGAKLIINEKEIDLTVGLDRDKLAESLANVIRHLTGR